jgi:hypothetical protein
VHTKLWYENLKERGDCKNLGVDGRIILKLMIKKWDGRLWTGFICLRIRTSGGLL